MSNREDIALMAHLMRRAGFGATRDELEALAEQGYEETVERLISPPDDLLRADQDILFRYIPSTETGGPNPIPGAAQWLYHMINTQRPLEEKMALFWHNIFATGNSKVDNDNHLSAQTHLFRNHGMGNYRELLIRVAQNPAMIFWLDNNENHKRTPNENWGQRAARTVLAWSRPLYRDRRLRVRSRVHRMDHRRQDPPTASPQVLLELPVQA